jgi:uncharacterized membrane protein
MEHNQTRLQNDNNKQLSIQHVSFSGPVPPPGILEGYERLVPGSAQKFIDAAMEQAKHRRELESKVIDSDIRNSKLGLYFGLIIGISGLVSAVITSVYGSEVISAVLGAGTLVALVGAFIYGSQGRQADDKKEKNENEE